MAVQDHPNVCMSIENGQGEISIPYYIYKAFLKFMTLEKLSGSVTVHFKNGVPVGAETRQIVK